MEKAQRNRLAERLERHFTQREREVLLQRLGVNPEECTLGATTPEEVAWRMVGWFSDRDRLPELEQAARASWLRRLVWRFSLGSGVSFLLLAVGLNLFDSQARLCGVGLFQPALADTCGALGIGGKATREERLAWQAMVGDSCDALRHHLTRFPSGAYRDRATTRLAAKRVIREPITKTREQLFPLYMGRDESPKPTREAAMDSARSRARKEAQKDCKGYVAIRQHHLRSVRIVEERIECGQLGKGHVCGLQGQSGCTLDEVSYLERESCPEGERRWVKSTQKAALP